MLARSSISLSMAVTSSSWDNEEFKYDSNLLLCARILSFWARRRKFFLMVASSCLVSLFKASICVKIGEMTVRSRTTKKIKAAERLKINLSRGERLAIFLPIVCRSSICFIHSTSFPAWPRSQNRRGRACPLCAWSCISSSRP